MRPGDDDEGARLEQAPGDVVAYLALAREIAAEVAHIAGDESAGAEAIAELFDRMRAEERAQAAREVFAALPVERQWALLAELFADDELRAALDEAHRAGRELLDRSQHLDRLRASARAEHRLDLTEVPPDTVVVVGLYPAADAPAALRQGSTSTTCARRLVLRSTGEPGSFRVIEDTFNPNGAYFVTAEYDKERWQATERLPSHALVRIGAIHDGPDGAAFETALYPGARLDVEHRGRISEGRLHVGFATVGDRDVFTN